MSKPLSPCYRKRGPGRRHRQGPTRAAKPARGPESYHAYDVATSVRLELRGKEILDVEL